MLLGCYLIWLGCERTKTLRKKWNEFARDFRAQLAVDPTLRLYHPDGTLSDGTKGLRRHDGAWKTEAEIRVDKLAGQALVAQSRKTSEQILSPEGVAEAEAMNISLYDYIRLGFCRRHLLPGSLPFLEKHLGREAQAGPVAPHPHPPAPQQPLSSIAVAVALPPDYGSMTATEAAEQTTEQPAQDLARLVELLNRYAALYLAPERCA